MWFKKNTAEALNTIDVSVCNPVVVNQTNHSIVLFMDRGVLYNKQVLAPGEALGMTTKETAGIMVPYKLHAVVGDEKNLPTRMQSAKNLISTAVIPTAFIIGTLAAASSAGTLSGPSAALGRAATGMVIKGMVIDSAALAAGSLSASRAAVVADKLIEKHPLNFSAKSGLYRPGNRYVVVRGGIDTPLTITTITERQFRQIPVLGEVKVPMDTLQDKLEYYTPSMLLRLSGRWQETKSTKSITAGSTAIEETGQLTSAESVEANDDEEERQLLQAIQESLKMEDERKRMDAEYSKRLQQDKRRSVKLF